jgi:hypothetical protein
MAFGLRQLMPALRRTEFTRTLFVRMTGDLFGAAVSSRPTLSAVEMRSSEDHGQLKCRGVRAHCPLRPDALMTLTVASLAIFVKLAIVKLVKKESSNCRWDLRFSRRLLSCFLSLGFGAVLICWWMPTFQRNILSPSSRAEVTRQGNRGLI